VGVAGKELSSTDTQGVWRRLVVIFTDLANTFGTWPSSDWLGHRYPRLWATIIPLTYFRPGQVMDAPLQNYRIWR
jgi:hypothetical protein